MKSFPSVAPEASEKTQGVVNPLKAQHEARTEAEIALMEYTWLLEQDGNRGQLSNLHWNLHTSGGNQIEFF